LGEFEFDITDLLSKQSIGCVFELEAALFFDPWLSLLQISFRGVIPSSDTTDLEIIAQ